LPHPRSLRPALALLVAAAVVAGLAVGASLLGGSTTPGVTAAAAPPAELPAAYREADDTVVLGRDLRLNIDDTDKTAFAVLSRAEPTDQVWLDRSWDGGRTWEGKVGATRVPRLAHGTSTAAESLEKDRANGVVRACGEAGNRSQVACTRWRAVLPLPRAGAAWDAGAVDALMSLYDRRTGLWRSTGWWNSANTMTTLVDYMLSTHDHRYLWAVSNTYDRNLSAKGGSFTNSFLDDTGWWALGWIRAYDLTHDQRYLRTAQADVDHMWSYHDDTCGGGVWWTVGKRYKNAITNELYIKAAAELHSRLPGDRTYLSTALATWHWFRASGMINGEHLVNDGLDARCRNNGDTTWTYNQGVVLGGLTDLAAATGDRRYLRQAEVLADASTRARALHEGGGLTEPCEADDCGIDGPSFKGIYVRNLGELAVATSSARYRSYLQEHARAAHEHDRTPYDQYGEHWAGPVGPITGATQQSAVDLMVAAGR